MTWNLRACRRAVAAAFAAAALLAGATTGGAWAQAQKATSVVGELLITVPHGTDPATVTTLAGSVKGTVVKNFGTIDSAHSIDCYWIRLPATATAVDTDNAINRLKAAPGVRGAWHNNIEQHDGGQGPTFGLIPNDTLFPKQWDLLQIHMPQGWTLQLGSPNVVIADVDTGVDLTHPDFQGRAIFQPYNSVTGSSDVTPLDEHGTMTAGTAAAVTNNNTGIAGVAWNSAVKLMPILTNLTDASIIASMQWVTKQQAANPNLQFVVNCSFGNTPPTVVPILANLNPVELAVLAVANAGNVVCCSAGNAFQAGNPPHSPAYLTQLSPNIICVAATGDTGVKASYSQSQPYTDVAAPGGEFDLVGINVMVPVNLGSYALWNINTGIAGGTSHATPMVTGVAALLLSTPGVTPSQVKQIIRSTAQPAGGTIPNSDYGYGILDAYAALVKVSVGLTIIEPQGTGGKSTPGGTTPAPIETETPEIRVQVGQVPPGNLVIQIDNGRPVPEATAQQAANPYDTTNGPYFTVENVQAYETDANGKQILDPNGNPIPLVYQAVIRNAVLTPGQHTVTVGGTTQGQNGQPGNPAPGDTRTFTVTPHQIAAGRSMISFPYYELLDPNKTGSNQIKPENYLGTNFQLSRWVPSLSRYAFYSAGGVKDPDASFEPPDLLGNPPRQDGDPANAASAKWPLGIGYWSDTQSIKPVLTSGRALTDRSFLVPLVGNGSGASNFISWNMVGDPFPVAVPFNALLVDTPSGRLGIQQAADAGYILPVLYAYDPNLGYTFQALPSGTLAPWQSYWVGVTTGGNLTLVIPPAAASRAATRAASAISASGDSKIWTLQIGAHLGNLNDASNFIGASTAVSTDGYNRLSVPKPPMVSPFVSLGIAHQDWGTRAGLYARDIRTSAGTKTWHLTANTDQPNSTVTLTWNSATLPRAERLTITDDATGIVTDMRARGSVTFTTGSKAAPRTYTVTATTATYAPVTISNVAVRPSGTRASGALAIGFTLTGDASYEVSILNNAGAPVATVATRAASTGNVSVVWNGRRGNGMPVPTGTYLVQIRATGADGSSVRALQPYTVVR